MELPAGRRLAQSIWTNLGFICIGLALCYCLVRAFDPPRLNWGDSGSDYNVLTSGRNFDRYGFVALKFTPHLLRPEAMTRPYDGMYLYTHYPQLPDVMNGVLRRVFGLSAFPQFRLFALMLSFGSLWFIYHLVQAYWSRQAAQVAIGLWVLNPLWIQHADYLHHLPYGAFFGFGSAWALVRFLERPEQRRWLVVSAAMLFLVVLSSYDWWFFGPLLVTAIVVGHYRALFHREGFRILALLAAATIAGAAVKFATNAWALGWDGFVHDLLFQVRERSTDEVSKTDFRDGIWRTLYGRVDRFFTPLLFLLVAYWSLAPLLRRRLAARGIVMPAVRNPIMLLLIALPFLALFVEIWVGQYYPTVLVIPFYAVAGAVSAILLIESASRTSRLAGAVMIGWMIANSVEENLSFPIAYFEPAAIATLGPQLDSVSPRDIEVLVNHVFDAPYRYYFERRTMTTVLMPRGAGEQILSHIADSTKDPNRSTGRGAILVQHKHVADELYDKGLYHVLAKVRAWTLWGNPREYRDEIRRFVMSNDSLLAAAAARTGRKLYETDFYSVWRIDPPVRGVGQEGLVRRR
jgi:hypothetical protein